jgi:hypothetical protein
MKMFLSTKDLYPEYINNSIPNSKKTNY